MNNNLTRDDHWTTFDGKKIKIKDLTNDHLFNLITYVDKRCELSPQFRHSSGLSMKKVLREEVEIRHLVKKFEAKFKRSLWAELVVVDKSSFSSRLMAKLLNQYEITEEELLEESQYWKNKAENKKKSQNKAKGFFNYYR